jgi:uncharacterized membrane protein
MTRTSRILGGLLAASVAVNLVIAGMVVGAHLRRPPPPVGPELGMTLRAPHGLRPSLEQHFAAARPQLDADGAALRQARRAFADSLRREPFDRDATAAAMAELRQAADRQRHHLHDVLLEVYAGATPEERREAARSYFRRMEGGRMPGPPPGPPPGPAPGASPAAPPPAPPD